MTGLPECSFDTVAIPRVQMRSPLLGDYACANTTGQIDGHPKLVTFFQPQLEEVLRARLAHHPSVEVRAGVEVTRLEQSEGSSRLHLRARDQGEESCVEASYVVGCDGANSFIRKALGLEMKGRTFLEDWLVVDARNAPQPIDHIEFICDPARPAPHMPAPGGRRERWEFKLRRGATREQDGTARDGAPAAAPVDQRRARGARARRRLSLPRAAGDRFSIGRVFLAGDVAHLTPPFAGQGLVSGLRDAANLAWKLAAVVQRRASAAILDSYSIDAGRTRQPPSIWLSSWPDGDADEPLAGPRGARPGAAARAVPTHAAALRRARGSREGLFRACHGARFGPGTAFPQGAAVPSGEIKLSDDVLGDGLCLVGLGVNPAERLTGESRARWEALGGRIVQITHRGQRLNLGSGVDRCEDTTGRFLERLALAGLGGRGAAGPRRDVWRPRRRGRPTGRRSSLAPRSSR